MSRVNLSPFPHFLSISSSYPHSLSISSQPGCKAATIRAALVVAITLSKMMLIGTMTDPWFDGDDVAFSDDQTGDDDIDNGDERDDDDFSYSLDT